LSQAAEYPALAKSSVAKERLPAALASSLRFEQATQKSSGSGALAYVLYVDHTDPVFAEAAVESLSESLETYFTDRTKSSIEELKTLITRAQEKLMPDLDRLETDYETFRKSESNLAWDESGNLTNRFREKQAVLESQRLDLETQKGELDVKLATILNTASLNRDNPIVVMQVVSQLMNANLDNRDQQTAAAIRAVENPTDPRLSELRTARITVERSLFPLEVERDQYADSYGPLHPTVVKMDQQIEKTRAKLEDLITQESLLQAELELQQPDEVDPQQQHREKEERAKMVVNTFVRGLRARLSVLDSQIALLDQQIDDLRISAAELADAEREDAMFRRKIERSQKLLSQVEEQMARINLTDQGTSIRVQALMARTKASRVAPLWEKTLGFGALFGALFGCGLVYLLESFSKTYRSSDEIAQSLDLQVLGQVPRFSNRMPREAKNPDYRYRDVDSSLEVLHRPRSITSESIRRIRTSIFFEAAQKGMKVIQVTSPVPEDGKSTVSSNLAASIAIGGKSVVLVDADLRRPQTSQTFKLSDRQGVTQLLNGECEPTEIVYSTPIENLSVVPSGAIPGNPAEALAMSEFSEFIEWLRERYDFVIVDTPPLLVVADPVIVSRVVDGVVFAFRIRRGCRPQTKEAVGMLRANQAPVLGCVVNQVNQRRNSKYKVSHAGSYYYHKYERKTGKQRQRNSKEHGGYEVRSSGSKPIWSRTAKVARETHETSSQEASMDQVSTGASRRASEPASTGRPLK